MDDKETAPPDQAVITRRKAYDLFRRLDELLPVLPQKAEIYAIGGAAIALEYNPVERRTEDIDCIIKRYREEVIEAAERLAIEAEGELPLDWLNEFAYQHHKLPKGDDEEQRTSYEGTRLIVHSAGPERLLAMKIHAQRDKDHADIRLLVTLTGVDGIEAARSIYRAAYPGKVMGQKASKLIAEATKENNRTTSKPTVPESPDREPTHARISMPAHPTAKLDPLSRVDPNAEIGAQTVIEADTEVQRGARIDEDTIIRTGSCVREGAQIGANCDIAAFYVGRNARIGNGAKLHTGSSVGDETTVGDAVHLKPGTQIGHNTTIQKRTKLGPCTYVHPNTTVGSNVTTGEKVSIGNSAQIGNDAAFGNEAHVAPHARIGSRTSVGEKVCIGIDAKPGMTPTTTVGNDCTLGDESQVSSSAHMKDGCTLEAHARLDDGAVMEPGSTVGAGSNVERNAVVREGETIPPSTLVAIDGTRRPLAVDREVRVHPDDSSRKLPETPPPAPAPAAEAAQRASKRRHDGPSR